MEISSHKKVGFAIATSGSDRLHLKNPHRYLRSLSSSIATSGSGAREGGYIPAVYQQVYIPVRTYQCVLNGPQMTRKVPLATESICSTEIFCDGGVDNDSRTLIQLSFVRLLLFFCV